MFAGGKVDPKGKSKASSLLTLIRYKSEDLYELICDLGLDGTFRSQRYQNTFLLPNDKILKDFVKELEKEVNQDKEENVINTLRSMLLKGHLSKSSFKKDANIGTVQLDSQILANPEEVGKNVDSSPYQIIATKTGAYATVVLTYNDTKPPATTEGKSGGNILVGSMVGGNAGEKNEELEKLKKFTKELIVKENAHATVANFFKAVASALAHLEGHDSDKFKRAKYYLAANPIISWFFLTMPGRSDSLIFPSDVSKIDISNVPSLNIIKKAETHDYEISREFLKSIKSNRSITEDTDKKTLIREIKSKYMKMAHQALKVGAIDQLLEQNVDLKMLMDEVRFMYEGAVDTWEQVDDALSSLGAINWVNPTKSMVICDCDTYNSDLVKGIEAFISGPVKFVKSIYFMYVPLTGPVEEQLVKCMEKSGGSIYGGNPALINNVVFSGGAARKKLNKSSPKLGNFVRMLSGAQREELLAMLQKK